MSSKNGSQPENKMLSFDDILAAPDIETMDLFVPEWGGAVKIQGLSRKRLDFLRRQSTNTRTRQLDQERFASFLFRDCLVEPKLTEEQYQKLLEKPAGPVARIEAEMMRLCGLSEAAVEEAEAIFPEDEQQPD